MLGSHVQRICPGQTSPGGQGLAWEFFDNSGFGLVACGSVGLARHNEGNGSQVIARQGAMVGRIRVEIGHHWPSTSPTMCPEKV